MSDFKREALIGGDNGVWGEFEQAQNYPAISIITSRLYDNGGQLYIGPGRIGINNDSNIGVCRVVDTGPISLAGLTVSCWARVSVSVTGTTVNIHITSIAGATNPATLPATFTGAYNGYKGGYYVISTRRVVGLVWINAGGALEGIINCLDGSAYAGYSTSDDIYDTIYNFNYQKYSLPLIPERKTYEQSAAFTAGVYYSSQFHRVTTAAASFNATIPAASAARVGQRIRVEKIDTGAGIITVTRTGADTLGSTGATAFPLRCQGDFIELECVSAGAGYAWACIDSLSTLDSAVLIADQLQTLAHGLGARSKSEIKMLCIIAELGYAINDETMPPTPYYEAVSNRVWSYAADATNFYTRTAVSGMLVHRKDTGATATITPANWKFRIRYKI